MQVIAWRCEGRSYDAIAAALNLEGIPTPAGRSLWQKSYVFRLLHTRYARQLRTDGTPQQGTPQQGTPQRE